MQHKQTLQRHQVLLGHDDAPSPGRDRALDARGDLRVGEERPGVGDLLSGVHGLLVDPHGDVGRGEGA